MPYTWTNTASPGGFITDDIFDEIHSVAQHIINNHCAAHKITVDTADDAYDADNVSNLANDTYDGYNGYDSSDDGGTYADDSYNNHDSGVDGVTCWNCSSHDGTVT